MHTGRGRAQCPGAATTCSVGQARSLGGAPPQFNRGGSGGRGARRPGRASKPLHGCSRQPHLSILRYSVTFCSSLASTPTPAERPPGGIAPTCGTGAAAAGGGGEELRGLRPLDRLRHGSPSCLSQRQARQRPGARGRQLALRLWALGALLRGCIAIAARIGDRCLTCAPARGRRAAVRRLAETRRAS